MLSSVNWIGLGDGSSWNDPANWSSGTVPTAANDVTLTTSLLIPSGTTVRSNTVKLENAQLTLSGGTIEGGAIISVGTGSVNLTNSGGTLNGVTIDSPLNLTANGSRATITNGLTLNRVATLGPNARLNFLNSQSLLGTGTVLFQNHTANALVAATNNMTLTIGPDITIRGGGNNDNSAQIGLTQTFGGGTNSSVIIQGTILADSPSMQIALRPGGTGTLVNTGTLKLAGGDIHLGGNFTRAGIGTIERTSGEIHITGRLDNSGDTLELNSITGSFYVSGGTIFGGTVSALNGTNLFADQGGYLDGVRLIGDLDLTTTGSYITVLNGLELEGTATLGNGAGLYFDGTQTLSGTGTILFQNVASNRVVISQENSTLTLGPNITVRGGGASPDSALLGHSSPSITTSLVIHGTVIADQPGLGIRLKPGEGSLKNHGTIQIDGGDIYLGGEFKLTDLGNLVRNGGNVHIIGALRNENQTLTLDASTGSWNLFGGRIYGGRVVGNDGAVLTSTGQASILDRVTLDIDLNIIDNNNSSSYLQAWWGLTVNRTVTLSGPEASLQFYSLPKVEGSGTIVLNTGSSGGIRTATFVSGVPTSGGDLTIGAGITIRGNSGIIRATSLQLQGTVEADIPGGALSFEVGNAKTLNNSGTINVNGGSLSFTNSGENFSFENTGTINVGSGGINLGGRFSLDSLGRLNRTGGTLTLKGTLDNSGSELQVNDTTGDWRVYGGEIIGGSIRVSGNARLILAPFGTSELADVIVHGNIDFEAPFTSTTPIRLDSVTVNGNINNSSFGTDLTISNGLTLNGTATLGAGVWWYFEGTQLLDGNGTMVFQDQSGNAIIIEDNQTLTIGSGITIRGGSQGSASIGATSINGNLFGGNNSSLLNLGRVLADVPGTGIRFTLRGTGRLTNSGTIAANGGAISTYSGSVQTNTAFLMDGIAILTQTPSGRLETSGNLLTSVTNPTQFNLAGFNEFNSDTRALAPQLLEVAGQDLGLSTDGFHNNFAMGTLRVRKANSVQSTYLKLVDLSDNSLGSAPEALYAHSVIVDAGATLDLNGIKLYTKGAQIDGTVINGQLEIIPDSGPVQIGVSTPGRIQAPGELDEWTFFSRGGREITVELNPGNAGLRPALAPFLNWATVQLLDGNNQILSTASNSQAGGEIRLHNVSIPLDGIFKVRVFASSGHAVSTGNYTVSLYDTTPTVRSLNLNQTVSGTLLFPYAEDHWTFTGDGTTSLRFDFKNASTSGISFTLTGPNNSVVIPETTGDYPLVTLPFAGSYTLIAHHLTGGTGSYSFSLDQTTQKILPFNGSLNDTLAGTGQALLYKVSVPATQVLSLLLNDSSTTGRAEMYARFGSPPTRSVYDYRFASPGSSQSILIPSAAAGDWYVLVYGEYVPQSRSFTLASAGTPTKLTSITPESIGNSEPITLTLSGAGFLAGTTVELISADGLNSYAPTAFSIDSYSQITAMFPSNLPVGAYSVRINSLGNSSMLAAALNITGAGEGKFESEIILPNEIGINATATLYIRYKNSGTTAIKAPLLSLESPDITAPRLTLDSASLVPGFWTNAEKPVAFSARLSVIANGKTPGILQPGEIVQIPVYLAGTGGVTSGTVRFNLSVVDDTDTSPMDWNALKQDLNPDWISSEAWNPIFQNLLNDVGGTSGDYVRFLSEIDNYLGRLGDSAQDVAQKWGFAIQQANGINPVSTLAAAVDASLPAPGLALSFGRSFGETINNRYQMGAFGRGWSVPWQTSLVTRSDGTVVITTDGGNQFVYQKDSRTANSYFGANGDMNMLMAGSMGMYMWMQMDGTVTAFRADGKLSYVQDTNGNRITASYNGSGRLATLTHSSGQNLNLAYNGAGLISSVTDSTGRQSIYSYDAANQHLMSVQTPAGTTRYTYSVGNGAATEHALTSVEYPDGTHRFFTYNAAGHLASTSRDGNNERLNYTYDQGKVTATDLLGNSTSTFFNHLGLLRRTVDALGNSTYFQYDPKSLQVSRIIDPTGLTQTFSYDTHGDLASSTDALGQTTIYTHGTYSRLTSLTDAKGNKTVYTYDPQGNLLSTTYDNGSRESATFDPLGNPFSFTNRRGQAVTYTYNPAGQVTRQTFPDGSFTDFVYDLHGILATATDVAGTTTLTYDAADRLTRIDYPDGMFLQFTLDAGGRRTRMVDQTGFTVNYFYDNVGRLAGLRDGSNAPIVTYTYDVSGRLSRKENANGTSATYEYDRNGNVLHLINYAPGGSINSRFDYTYDLLGRRTTMGTLEGDWSYTYDATGQLTHAVFDSFNSALIPDQDLVYNYDALGNRTSTVINGVTTVYTSNNLNQYVAVGGVAQRYDADGNLLSVGTNTYVYDDLGRLISVTGPEGMSSYTYDALGNRSSKTVNGQLTLFLNDPTGLVDVVGEFDSTGAVIAHNTYGHGLTSRSTGGQRYFFEFEAIGNTARMTDAIGVLVNSYSYRPFGESISSAEAVSTPFQFVGMAGVQGEINDVSYMRARSYLVELGGFTSNDPIGLLGNDFNLRRYANNNPIDLIDPSGLASRKGGRSRVRTPGINYEGSYTIDDNGNKRYDHARYELGVNGSRLQGYWFYDYTPEEVCAGTGIGFAFEFYDLPFEYFDEQYECKTPPQSPPSAPDPGPGKPGGNGEAPTARAIDPNDKFGPGGFGTQNFVQGDDPIPYRIRFENYGPGSKDHDGNPVDSSRWATAPAQFVTVSDFLSSDLDWDTFRLSEIGFGDVLLTVPPDSTHYQTSYPMTYNGKTFDVLIEAGIRIATGEVFIIFQSIDPTTELPPDVLTGFLPPEDETGRGMGHFSYSVKSRAGLPSGTPIRNIALISFDGQLAIATDQIDPLDPSQGIDPNRQALITIDAAGPTSVINTLPATTNNPAILLNWSGTDDQNGSGIAYYDVYVSENNGPFTLFLSQTTQTSATLNGVSGKSYRFYTLATDNVGHRQTSQTIRSIQVVGNNAPVLNSSGTPALDAILVNTPNSNNPGTLVSTLIARMAPNDGITDPDPAALRGIAVVGLTGTANGTWQFSLNNGTTWSEIAATGTINARLLAADANTRVRFFPNSGFTGSATFAFVAWDRTEGANGQLINAGNRGGSRPYSSDWDYASITVNTAPVLNTAGSPTLDPITVDIPIANNVGTLVSTLISRMSPLGGITDVGTGVQKGIAINGLTGTATGKWQYSLNNGAGWANILTTGNFDALLLAADDKTRIRYVPNSGFTGEAKIAFVAWDRSSGINGGIANVASRGGTTPYSLNYEYASVTVNTAPVLNTAGSPTLDPITVNIPNANNVGTLVSTLISRMSPLGGITDVGTGVLKGIAINGLTGTTTGQWQYSLNNGAGWANILTTGNFNALLLAADDKTRIRYVPNSGFTGEAKIAFVAWDRSTGVNGGTANVASRGGTTPYSLNYDYASVTVNTAPFLTTAGSPTLDPITVNISNANNVGTLVSTLISRMSPLGGITDVGTGVQKGIAVVGLTGTTNGTWQFSLNNGSSWSEIAATGSINARLLAADSKTRIRFVPNPGFTGTATFAFVAWDLTEGTNGQLINAGNRGGTRPYSLDYDYASITVNTAPVLNTAGSPTLDPIPANVPNASNPGTMVSTLISRMAPLGGITDVGTGVLQGIAINGLVGTGTGTWQYSLNNGSTWTNMAVTGNLNALLLASDPNTRIRYLPNAGFTGEAKIAFVAWDRSTGVSGGTANVASRGGTTAFSTAYEYASITVNPPQAALSMDFDLIDDVFRSDLLLV